jgi:hypothetical protein
VYAVGARQWLDIGPARVHAGGMLAMVPLVALSCVCACVAGFAAWACAYDRAFPVMGRNEARRLALRAIPGPFSYFLVLGLIVSFLLPWLVKQ